MENAKERIRGTNDRCRTKTQQEWERDRESEQEICHNTWKSHAKLEKRSLESTGILKPGSNRSLPGHSIETILASERLIHAWTNLLKAPMTSKYLTEMLGKAVWMTALKAVDLITYINAVAGVTWRIRHKMLIMSNSVTAWLFYFIL